MVGRGPRMASSRIEIDGITLNYAIRPAAAPVVCLNHCFASDHRYWDPHLPAFEGFRVLRRCPWPWRAKPPGPYSLEMMASVVGLLSLDIEQVHICGVSMGGMIAQTVALDHPDRVASIALVNTTSEYSDDQLQAWRDRAALVLRDGMEAVRERFGPMAYRRGRRRQQSRLRLHGGNDRPLLRGELRCRKCRHVRSQHDAAFT